MVCVGLASGRGYGLVRKRLRRCGDSACVDPARLAERCLDSLSTLLQHSVINR